MKPGIPPLQTIRSPDQMRERIWSLHYSLKIEKPAKSHFLAVFRYVLGLQPNEYAREQLFYL